MIFLILLVSVFLAFGVGVVVGVRSGRRDSCEQLRRVNKYQNWGREYYYCGGLGIAVKR